MNINIIMCGRSRTFIELVNAFALSMSELGHTINNIYTYAPESGINPDINNHWVDVNVYIGVMVTSTRKILDKGVFNVLFNTEQQGHIEIPDGDTSTEMWMYKTSLFDMVIDMFKNNSYYNEWVYCPVGWSPCFETTREPMEKVFDIMHLGRVNSRRKHNKNYYHEKYQDIITVRNGYGEDRDDIILQTKIYLILRRGEVYEFPQIRSLFAMCNKVFVLTSSHSDYGGYEPNKHFIVFDDRLLKPFSKHWLSMDKQREEFAEECYRDIKENHMFTMHLEQALKGTILQRI